MNRKYNMKILWKLFLYCLQNKHIRFNQVLWNLGINEKGVDIGGVIYLQDKHHQSSRTTFHHLRSSK